jgi:hypothetical protein
MNRGKSVVLLHQTTAYRFTMRATHHARHAVPRARVVNRAHGIVPGRFEQLYFALLCPIESRGSKRFVVVVDATARELDHLAVQKKPLSRRPGKRADAESCHHLVDHEYVQSGVA